MNDIHRQRLIAALEHRQPDHFPLTFGGPSCSVHRTAHLNLLNHLGLVPQQPETVFDRILQIVEPDPQLTDYFGIDALWLLPEEGPVEWGPGGESYVDEFGRRFVAGGGFFNLNDSPLKEGSLNELEQYTFPQLGMERVRGMREKAKRLYAAGYGLGVDGPWGVYEIASSLRGTAELLMDMALNPEYAEALAERVLVEHHIPFYTLLLEAVGPYVQLVVISDDLGSQEKLIFSPRMFRRIYKPRLRRLIEHIHSLAPQAKVYMHSDGAIASIIPDLIEIGVQGLNPVQYTAKGMDTSFLKREFGKDLGFFGGTIDNEVLSFGTPEEVYSLVRKQVEILAPGGGFLFASNHNISPEVPPENIIALFNAGRED